MKDVLSLTIFGRSVRVRCEDARTENLLLANYSHMQESTAEGPELCYTVGSQQGRRPFFINREGHGSLTAADDGEFLFLFEKDMTIELQKLRRDLYFIHAAVLESMGSAFMLIAPSGGGKSTTTWGLLHHGFNYLSDELGPVDLKTHEVHPYPHAICLKDNPPGPYPLPGNTVYTARTLHVPTENLPGKLGEGPIPLQAVFFLNYCPGIPEPALQPVSKAQATARIFAATLNLLAHPGEGLDGAIAIAKQCASFELRAADLRQTCELLRTSVDQMYSRERFHSGELPSLATLSGGVSA